MKKFIVWFSLVFGFAFIATVGQPTQQVEASEKTYTIATDVTFPPFVYANSNNKYVGIDMELIKAVAKKEGFKVEIKPIGFNAAIQAVQSGQVDGMIAGMSITTERKKTFDFSNPYYSSGIVMAVKKGSKVTSLKQLKGKTVAIKTGTSGADYANSIKKKYGFKTVTFDDSDSVYDDVKTGNAVACFDDSAVLQYGVKTGLGLKIVTKPTDTGNYGFAVRKGHNQVLLNKFNKGLKALKKDGTYAKIIEKYTGKKAVSAQKKSSENSSDSYTMLALLKQNKSAFISGIEETLWLTIVGILFATIFGILIGLLGVVPSKIAQGLSTTIIYIFRGLPLIVLALFIYNGIPSLTGTKVPAFVAGIITLTLNEGAYIGAFVKGGIEAVDSGQMEAARSLGLPFSKSMRKVVLPQGIKIMIPSFVNQFIITLKDTSILSVIGILELTQTGKIIIARNLQGFRIWAIVAVIYLLMITVLTLLSKWIERRIKN
ncbi:amino acid ABC transporter substrate-binding protein/permease [Ligilactobacillus sp. WILCCON 0076]|uniref:Amino acid ABC transporter substrate-binding protein/permease n=1 Tax=Ligilactobacillus ubinensis TaxID=2876789 RepID=A0A9X2JLE6_9LACO|nr:amino acid ABC transporter substrate-binding protein/permease [Ligilactobacillus ubinensis]MCP0885976.1 amino acid ABC transporter substrate-binding protein/permease [Ligilactobacillus ubinensis]